MALTPGTRLGPYQVTAAAGAGGMGEVYRATDTSLKRTVALKVLPASVAGDADRLARFQREAEVLAALNHPNIAALFGLETSGDVKALVMEFVEGPTLADRIDQRPLPLDEALPIAAQIAEALEAAHERGIIHRDLKPANVKVRPDGTVKVLDFGLARNAGAEPPASGNPAGSDSVATRTSPAMTAAGMILGTASYMAPEHARGRPLDRRVDIWAFGCVLYEMLTGRRAFPGDDLAEVMASVITREPDLAALPAATPAHVRALLARCFVKDPRQRLRDIGEARLQLSGPVSPRAPVAAAPAAAPARSPWTPILAGALVLVTVGLAYALLGRPTVAPPAPTRLAINMPEGAHFQKGQPLPSLAFSPDGRSIVYTARGPEGNQLWIRDLNQFAPAPIPGTRGGRLAAFSPDGRWVAFAGDNMVKKLPVTLGPPVEICAHVDSIRGLTWTDAGEIVFATRGAESAVWRVAAGGGQPVHVTSADLAYPDALPGGRAVLATAHNTMADQSSGDLTIVVLDLADGTVTKLFDGGTFARYVPSGHIAYLRGDALMAAPFDARTLAVGEARVPMIADVFMDHAVSSGNFAISSSGALAYAPGGPADFERTLVAIEPGAAEQTPDPLVREKRAYSGPRISPDGRLVAVSIRAWRDRVWIVDVARQTFSRLTSTDFLSEGAPVWAPDGRSLVFRGVLASKNAGLYRVAVDGGEAQMIDSGPDDPTPASWAPDGRSLVVSVRKPDGDQDILLVSTGGSAAIRPLLTTRDSELGGDVSPDGAWIAYQSNRSGRTEVYVSSFPSMEATVRVSIDGGEQPVWAPRGRRVYFRARQRVMAADLTGRDALEATTPVPVATIPSVLPTGFVDPMPDGRLLAIDGPEIGATPSLHIVTNWFAELRDKVR